MGEKISGHHRYPSRVLVKEQEPRFRGFDKELGIELQAGQAQLGKESFFFFFFGGGRGCREKKLVVLRFGVSGLATALDHLLVLSLHHRLGASRHLHLDRRWKRDTSRALFDTLFDTSLLSLRTLL